MSKQKTYIWRSEIYHHPRDNWDMTIYKDGEIEFEVNGYYGSARFHINVEELESLIELWRETFCK